MNCSILSISHFALNENNIERGFLSPPEEIGDTLYLSDLEHDMHMKQ